MKIEQIVQGDRAVLHLKGEFDTFHCPPFAGAVEALANSGVVRVALNLRLTPFLNSTALGALVKARKRLRDAGGELAIAHPSPFVKSVIEKVGLEKALRMFPDETQALAYLENPPAPSAAGAAATRDSHSETQSPVPVDAATVLFSLEDPGRRKTLEKEVGVGRLVSVEDEGLTFAYGGPDAKVEAARAAAIFGSEAAMRLKFWLPLYKKKGPLEVNTTALSCEPQEDGSVRVKALLGEVSAEDRRAIQQFVRDMKFLKSAAKQAAGKK